MPSKRRPILDLHAHFPMQFDPPRRDCDTDDDRKRNTALMNFANLFNSGVFPRVTLNRARDAEVSFGSVAYLPADELWGPCNPFKSLRAMLNEVETEARKKNFKVARNAGELKAFSADDSCLFHCVEGGYAVGDPSNIAELADRGIAYITPAHLLFRNVSANVNGFPFMDEERYERMFPMPTTQLTEYGLKLCDEMIANGIVIDMTHMTRAAMDQAIALAKGRGAPVIVSHTGLQETSSSKYALNVDLGLVRRIHETGGVVGVIFFDHWLRPEGSKEEGVTLVVNTIRRMIDEVGHDVVAIGSDLDGFIHPVKDLDRMNKMDRLWKILTEAFDDGIAQAVLWDNAFRMLERGWGQKRR